MLKGLQDKSLAVIFVCVMVNLYSITGRINANQIQVLEEQLTTIPTSLINSRDYWSRVGAVC